MFNENAVCDNPHYPILPGNKWDVPVKQAQLNPQVFQNPHEPRFGCEGSTSKPIIDLTKAPRSSEKLVDVAPQKVKLFEEPREVNKILQEPRYSDKYHFIEHQREPSPVRRSYFRDVRENTKISGKSIPQIDLTKAARKAVGCQSPIKTERQRLFEKPREAIKYTELDGARPKLSFGSQNPPREIMGGVIPNSARLFNNPREIMKYSDVEGCHTKNQINLEKPEHDLFGVVEPSGARKLFDEPRTWAKLASQSGPRLKQRAPEEPVKEDKRKLFATPREILKYQDVDGSHPKQFCPSVPRRPSPTFTSSVFA